MKIWDSGLAAHLRGDLKPCYLVCGDEPLLIRETLDALRACARERGYDGRELHVQLTGFDWSVLYQAGQAMSLFAEREIVELRLPTGKPGTEGSAAIADLAARAGKDLLFVVQAPRLDRRSMSTKWVKALESHGALVQVRSIEQRELPRWIAERMRRVGLEPDRDAVRVMADRVEGNLLAADQEIEKLRLLCGEGAVSADDVLDAVADSARFNVFQLVDAALDGQLDRAIRILDALRAEDVAAPLVVAVLARDLRQLAHIAETVQSGGNLGATLKRLRLWQARADRMRRCVARHDSADLRALLSAIRHAESVAKGQAGGDEWQYLTNIVWRLAAPRAAA